jgi:RNA polymerase sigma-70 factor, ECF subfamily
LQHAQQITDDDILGLIRSDSTFEQGFRLLMQTYQVRLYWQIRRIVQVHEDADDVVQNTLIKVYKGIGSFEGKSKLSTWLFRIAANEAITFCQTRNRKATDSLDNHAFALNSLESDSLADMEALSENLQLAVAELPEKQRIVFHLRYFEELPYEDISQMLDTSVGALKASYHHAVKKIERYFTETEEK